MHSYSTDFRQTPYIHIALAVVSFLLYETLKLLPLPPSFSIHPLVTLTIFGIVELLFDRMGWRLLCFFPVLRIYNFGGTYDGSIRGRGGAEYPAKLTIRQTWSRIEIDFESGDATSKSFSASVTHDRLAKGQIEIVYNYYAHDTHRGDERLGAHYGTAVLKRQNKGKRLEGDYFTEQKRDSFGRISVART